MLRGRDLRWSCLSLAGAENITFFASAFKRGWVFFRTPITTMCKSSLAGAENTTFFTPAFKRGWIFSVVKNTPVDSQTDSTPVESPQTARSEDPLALEKSHGDLGGLSV